MLQNMSDTDQAKYRRLSWPRVKRDWFLFFLTSGLKWNDPQLYVMVASAVFVSRDAKDKDCLIFQTQWSL